MGILSKLFGGSDDEGDPPEAAAKGAPKEGPKAAAPKAAARPVEPEDGDPEAELGDGEAEEEPEPPPPPPPRFARMPDERAVRAAIEQLARGLDAVMKIEAAVQPLVGMLQATAKSLSKSDQDRKQQFVDLRAHLTGEIDRLADTLRERVAREASIDVWKAVVPALDDIDHVLRETAEAGEIRGGDSLRMVRRRLRDALSRLGIEEIRVEEGVTLFDPIFHEGKPYEGDDATIGALPKGTAVRVERMGYAAGDAVLRCTLMTVVKG